MTVDYEVVSETYVVACHSCAEQYDLMRAKWCACDRRTRSLICPYCSRCFCHAGARYKMRVWNEAPKRLRESTSRFRLGDGEAASRLVPAAGTTPRVLVVDDEEDFRSLVVCFVEQMGYVVTAVSNPAAALTLLETSSFEVVVTDALMPGMDGRELCQKIRSAYGSRIKLIVMTSLYTGNRYKSEAHARFGVDEYLAKPLQFSVLKAAFDRVAPLEACLSR